MFIPLLPRIELTTARSIDAHTGRALLAYTPTFAPDVTARGALTFAVWQVWEDEPHTHAPAQAKALANARECMRNFAAALDAPNNRTPQPQ